MEYYVAEDERPLDKCLRDVTECDLYIGIFAWRYGFVPETDNPKKRSMTELEYRKAVELKKPRLLFTVDEDADWPMKFVDVDRRNASRLHNAAQKDRLSGKFSRRIHSSIVSDWKNATLGYEASVRGLAFHVAGHELHHLRVIRERYVR